MDPRSRDAVSGGGLVIGQAPAVRPSVLDSTLTGVHGRITWHDYPACDVHRFTILRSAPQAGQRVWSMRGAVSHLNPLTIRQQPLVFVAPFLGKDRDGRPKPAAWYWPIVSLSVHEPFCSVVLGPPIVPDTIDRTAQLQGLRLVR
jgi:hypothetical protein